MKSISKLIRGIRSQIGDIQKQISDQKEQTNKYITKKIASNMEEAYLKLMNNEIQEEKY